MRLVKLNALIALALMVLAPAAAAQAPPASSKGQTLYLPAVSYVYLGAKSKPYSLTKTFFFRNRDPRRQLTITAVDYYDGRGVKLASLLDRPQVLAPLASLQMPLPTQDQEARGCAPCLIVRWRAGKPVNPPLVQCIMIGATGQQGISFSTTATPIR